MISVNWSAGAVEQQNINTHECTGKRVTRSNDEEEENELTRGRGGAENSQLGIIGFRRRLESVD